MRLLLQSGQYMDEILKFTHPEVWAMRAAEPRQPRSPDDSAIPRTTRHVDTKGSRQVNKMLVTQRHILKQWEDQEKESNFSPAAEEETTWMATSKWETLLIILLCVSYILLCFSIICNLCPSLHFHYYFHPVNNVFLKVCTQSFLVQVTNFSLFFGIPFSSA